MPTAAKLVGAVTFALTAFLAAELFKPGMPAGTQFGFFSFICAGIGFVTGWNMMGKRTGFGTSAAISAGIQTSVTIAFFALFGFSMYHMVMRSIQLRYNGLSEAMNDVFKLLLENGLLMANARVIGALLVGGVVGGLLTDSAGRRWS